MILKHYFHFLPSLGSTSNLVSYPDPCYGSRWITSLLHGRYPDPRLLRGSRVCRISGQNHGHHGLGTIRLQTCIISDFFISRNVLIQPVLVTIDYMMCLQGHQDFVMTSGESKTAAEPIIIRPHSALANLAPALIEKNLLNSQKHLMQSIWEGVLSIPLL